MESPEVNLIDESQVYASSVSSTSRPGTSHLVLARLSCTCRSFRYRKRCRHVVQVLDALRNKMAAGKP